MKSNSFCYLMVTLNIITIRTYHDIFVEADGGGINGS